MQIRRQAAAENLHALSNISTQPPATDVAAARPDACVWMRAGVIRYRLCNQRFDCEHCLLDAALHGAVGPAQPLSVLAGDSEYGTVREDRLYTAGHIWVQPLNGAALCRVGLDAFAAALLGNVTAVSWPAAEAVLEPEEPACQIDLGPGKISVAAPFRGRIAARNEALRYQPAMVLRAPYDEGWLIELAPGDPADLTRLASPRAARSQISADLKRLRRALALQLLTDLRTEAPAAGEDARACADLRQLLAGSHYLELVTAFLH